MTQAISEYSESRKNAYNAFRAHINKHRLPFIFDKAIYKSDGENMVVECMFGHTMHIKPYHLKPVDKNNKIKLPQCWECEIAGVGAVELKHRVDIYYSSAKRIQVISPYTGYEMPMEYLYDGKRHMSSPSKLKRYISSKPLEFRY